MGWISDDCADKLCGLVAGALLVGAGLAVGGGLLPVGVGVAEAVVGAAGLATTMLRNRGKDPQAIYARVRKAVATGLRQQFDAERPGWAEKADAKSAVLRLADVAGRITFEGEGMVAAGLATEGIVRFLMLRIASSDPDFHPDNGNPVFGRLLAAVLRETFLTLRADPDFWASLRPDIDAATLAKLDGLLETQALVQAALDRIQRSLDVLVADLRWTASEKERIAVELARVQSDQGSTRTLILGFLETVLEREVAPDRIAAELMGLAANWRNARHQIDALRFSRNLSPDLADLRDRAAEALTAAEVDGGPRIAEALHLVETIEARERQAIERLDAEDAQARRDQERIARHRDEIANERRLRTDGLVATLETRLSLEKTRSDAKAAAATIARILDLQHTDSDDWHMALRSRQDEAYAEGRDRGTRLPLELAIELARIGLEQARTTDQRGALGHCLGSALQTLGQREAGTVRLTEAIAVYNAALVERTRDRVPLDWAMTQMNLGNALWTLGERETSADRLKQAVAAHRAALEEITRDRVPFDWAMVKMNLGVALLALGQRELGTTRLEEAVEAFHDALKELRCNQIQWAMTQVNLGNALRILGYRETGTERLNKAKVAYKAALEELDRDRVPLDWAMTQMNLGTVLQTLSERETGTALLEEAAKAYSAALEEFTRDRVPLDWAMTQSNLGNVLVTRGQRESGTAQLEEAVIAFDYALEEWTRDRVPLRWATTKLNRGNALRILGEREIGTEKLHEAVATYGEALEILTQVQSPIDWAIASWNFANAHLSLFEKSGKRWCLWDALARVDGALEIFHNEAAAFQFEKANQLRAEILLALGR